jgi:hypothetical protein
MIAGALPRAFAALLLAELLVAAHGCSRAEDAAHADEFRELYGLSEVTSQLEAVREFLRVQLQEQRVQWTSEQFDTAIQVVEAHFAEASVSERIIDRLAAQQDPRFVATVIDWLRTPEARRVHATAGITTATEAGNEFRDFMLAKQASPPSKARLALIERYDRAARRSSDSRRSLMLASYGVSLMADAIAADDVRAGTPAVREFVERRSELLTPLFEELAAIRLAFAFRDLSDADLAAFVEHSESDAVQWYYQAQSSALLDTLEEVSNGLGSAFVAALAASPDA